MLSEIEKIREETHFDKFSADFIYLIIYFWGKYLYPSKHFKIIFGSLILVYRDALHLSG